MEYRNAVFTETGMIDCEINHPDFGWIPFTACETDIEDHGRLIFLKIKEDGCVNPYVPDIDKISSQVRVQRNGLLAESDWSQSSDIPKELKNKWTDYRNKLRNITEQTGFPLNVNWPNKP